MNCQKAISVTNDILDTKVNSSSISIDLKIKTSEEAKKVLLETGINVLPSDTKTNIIKPPVSRPPISILPDDLNSVSCPICNKDHKKENIRDNIEDLRRGLKAEDPLSDGI
ncbi:15086_t:CDS:2 [Funneliformis mosseae]|uniref:15086_t:CDS:1 n=1 Tax=Funneliformis mosseae TaxID=27381 RepID=A0A9N9BLC5_FUNMO|nr:15086_t:CDS:2 [Funneliformis mosseae]